MTKLDLDDIAEDIARDTAAEINRRTPVRVRDMPYARQYTLEKVVESLKARI